MICEVAGADMSGGFEWRCRRSGAAQLGTTFRRRCDTDLKANTQLKEGTAHSFKSWQLPEYGDY